MPRPDSLWTTFPLVPWRVSRARTPGLLIDLNQLDRQHEIPCRLVHPCADNPDPADLPSSSMGAHSGALDGISVSPATAGQAPPAPARMADRKAPIPLGGRRQRRRAMVGHRFPCRRDVRPRGDHGRRRRQERERGLQQRPRPEVARVQDHPVLQASFGAARNRAAPGRGRSLTCRAATAPPGWPRCAPGLSRARRWLRGSRGSPRGRIRSRPR